LAIPLLRRAVPNEAAVEGITREKAIEVVEGCMKVLFYRDARSMNKYSMAIISGSKAEGEDGEKVDIEWRKNVELRDQSWKFAEGIRGYGAQTV
jgi:20S proteasome subunit beta 7